CNRLMGHDPDGARAGLIHFHRKAHGRAHSPDSLSLEPCNNSSADLVDLVAGAVKLQICHRTGSAANGLARHPNHEADERLGPRIVAQDLLAWWVQSGARKR